MSLEEDILIERFLRNELSDESRKDFLQKVDVDQDFKKQYLIEKQLFEALNEKDWSYFTTKDTKELEEYDALFEDAKTQEIKKNIQKASLEYKKRDNKFILTFSSIAAAVAVIVAFSFFFFNSSVNTEELYTEYIVKEKLPSLVSRGVNAVENNLVKAENNFKNKEYKKALIYIDEGIRGDKDNSLLYLYKAISHTELKEYNKAEKTLNLLINSGLVNGEKGYWFKSLLFLKSGKIDKVTENLRIIIQDSLYNQDKAKELLNKLDK